MRRIVLQILPLVPMDLGASHRSLILEILERNGLNTHVK